MSLKLLPLWTSDHKSEVHRGNNLRDIYLTLHKAKQMVTSSVILSHRYIGQILVVFNYVIALFTVTSWNNIYFQNDSHEHSK